MGLIFVRAAAVVCLAMSSLHATADIKIMWDTPLVRVDGSSMQRSEIGHYLINYVGPKKRGYKIAKAATNAYTFRTWGAGEYRFCIQTVDVMGLQSLCSPYIGKSIK